MIKRRNLFLQVLLMVVTFGIYGLYWFYSTAEDMKTLTKDASAQPALWTILLFVPIVSFYGMYKYSELFEKVSTEKLNRWIIFILWLAFAPAVWMIVQLDLNKKSGGQIAGKSQAA